MRWMSKSPGAIWTTTLRAVAALIIALRLGVAVEADDEQAARRGLAHRLAVDAKTARGAVRPIRLPPWTA